MNQENSVVDTVKRFILDQVLPDEDPSLLTTTTPLISSGILDSVNTLKLTLFLESEFTIEVEAQETSEEYLDTLEKICKLVESNK